MENLLSFHGKQEIKDKYIKRIEAHMFADEIIQGTGFDEKTNKGCAIGCTLDNYDHFSFETELGIPAILAILEDKLFEGLTVTDSKRFPLDVLTAIPVGVNLEMIYPKIYHFQLTNEKWGIIKTLTNENDVKYFTEVAELYQKLIDAQISFKEFKNAYLAYRARADLAYRYEYCKDLAEYFIQILKEQK